MKKPLIHLLFFSILLWGCPDTTSHSLGVYMLLDTSGSNVEELQQAEAIMNYLLGILQPGDSLGVARIDRVSFSEKDIIAKMNLDRRPSISNQQKRIIKHKLDEFLKTTKGSTHTDITGGILHSVEYLSGTGAGEKYILIFSDLEEDKLKGSLHSFPIQVDGCTVVVLNVTKLRGDDVDLREYYERVEDWRTRVRAGGGELKLINELEHLDSMFTRGA
jgi:hypothetical protein